MLIDRLRKYREKYGEVGVIDPETGEVIQDYRGRELLDSTPMAPPVGYKKQPSMVEIIRNMVRSERLKSEAEAAGKESFEDADNFEVADDEGELPRSTFENEFDPPVKELLHAGNEVVKEKAKKKVASPVVVDKVVVTEDDPPK